MTQRFTINDWLVEPSLNRISRGDEIVKIDPQNMKVLELLASRPGEVFSQTEIEQCAWPGVVVTPNSVYQSIAQLRRALGDDKVHPRYIETIPRRGYRLVGRLANGTARDATTGALNWRALRTTKPSSTVVVTTAVVAMLAIGTLVLLQPKPPSITHFASSEAKLAATVATPAELQIEQLEADLLSAAAKTAIAEGFPLKARDHLTKAIALERAQSGDRHRRVGKLLSELSIVSLWLGDYGAAESYARESVSIYEASPLLYAPRIEATVELGTVLTYLGKYDEAERLLLPALETSRSVHGEESFVMARIQENLSSIERGRGRLDEATKHLRRAVEIAKNTRMDKAFRGTYHYQLSAVLVDKGEYESARLECAKAIEMLTGSVPNNHAYLALAHEYMGKALLKLGKHADAESELLAALAAWESQDGAPWRIANVTSAIGELMLLQGRLDQAEWHLSYASQLMPTSPLAANEKRAIREHVDRLDLLSREKAQSDSEGSRLATTSAQRATP